MGVRFRKSINLGGGFKINLSKSGIGYSWGTKGYRISRTARGTTRRTYSIPGTGISYANESGGRNRNQNCGNRKSKKIITQPSQRQSSKTTYDQSQKRTIQSANISQFKQTEEDVVSNAVERTIRLNFIGTILLWGLLLIPINLFFVPIPIIGFILKIAAHTVRRVTLKYNFDSEKEDEHNRRIGAWQLLADGEKEWQIRNCQIS